MHFGITEKPTADCVSLHNNDPSSLKVSEEKKYPAKTLIAVLKTTPLSFEVPSPANIRISHM